MRREMRYLLLLFVFLSCNQNTDKVFDTEHLTQLSSESRSGEPVKGSVFDFREFPIQKGSLGGIEIGMTISAAEKNIEGLRREAAQATDFGYGGGSPAYLYYDRENLVFGLIPKHNSDTVLLILAISSDLMTINGLTPKATARQILEKYPKIKVNQDLMNGWEYISDTSNNFDFVFMTDKSKVGSYPQVEVPSDIRNLDIKAEWITIK